MKRLPLLFLALAPLAMGCQEKMGVEKRAEEIAAQKASASASASAKAAEPPDPKEQKYAAAIKAVRERTIAHLTALQKIYQGVPESERLAFRSYFPDTKEGIKDADEISKEAAFTGKEGMSIKKFDVNDVNFDEKIETGTVDVAVEESQRGKPRCITYKIDWKEQSGAWRRVLRKDFRIVPCT
ncbi:MAG: hypothetical protein ACXWUG_03205 [Polyangiales bacterium]